MKSVHKRLLSLLAGGFVISFGALAADQAVKAVSVAKAEIAETKPVIPITRAVAALNPTKGNNASGIVNFSVVDGGVRIVAKMEGLTPGKHGFHIHEYGDLSSPDAASAGGHFDPTHRKHGGPDHLERHAGDLGNIVADEWGFARYERVDSIISLNGPDSIIGKALIVNSNPDDFTTQPTGNSGGRVSAGLIVER